MENGYRFLIAIFFFLFTLSSHRGLHTAAH